SAPLLRHPVMLMFLPESFFSCPATVSGSVRTNSKAITNTDLWFIVESPLFMDLLKSLSCAPKDERTGTVSRSTRREKGRSRFRLRLRQLPLRNVPLPDYRHGRVCPEQSE